MTKMIMTQKLADELMDCLAYVAISGNGGAPIDENGEVALDDEQMELIETYARNTFCRILGEWETDGKEWDIALDDEEEA